MSFLEILQLIAVIGTALTGLVSIIWPLSVQDFTGLAVEGGRGKTEIRAILGAVFLSLALTAFFLEHSVSYPMLGYTYLGIALVRTISMFVDGSVVQSNIISIGVEIVFGIILIL